MKKLPELTLMFWVMKIFATTLGETAGDLFSMTMHLGYAVSSLIFLGFFVTTLSAQLTAKTYRPAIYWLVIVSTSTAGTTMSDFMDRTLALGYAMGALILVTVLALILVSWRFTAGSLAVDQPMSRRAEGFYWAAILISNTLGTAFGDFLADKSGLGFAGGAILVGSLLALVVIAARLTTLSRVLLFWAAYVLTRPFGATMGDVLTKSHQLGGLGFGPLGSSLILGSVLLVLVIWVVRHTGPQRSAAL